MAIHVILYGSQSYSHSFLLFHILFSELQTTVWNSELARFKYFEQTVVEIMHINVLVNCIIIDVKFLFISLKSRNTWRESVCQKFFPQLFVTVFYLLAVIEGCVGYFDNTFNASSENKRNCMYSQLSGLWCYCVQGWVFEAHHTVKYYWDNVRYVFVMHKL